MPCDNCKKIINVPFFPNKLPWNYWVHSSILENRLPIKPVWVWLGR